MCRTCEGFNARAFEETCRAVLIVPVGLCRQVPAIVDVIVLLLDLQAIKICWGDCAHGVEAWRKHIQSMKENTEKEALKWWNNRKRT